MIGAGLFLLGVVVGIAFLAVCNAWDRQIDTLVSDTLDGPDLDAGIAALDRLGKSANR